MGSIGPTELLVILVVVSVPILIVVGVIVMISSSRRRAGGAALATLDDRLARGEISPAEYDERRSRLT